MSNGSPPSIGTEEVVEYGCIEWADGPFSEIVVVGLDLGAAIIMRIFDKNFDHVGVFRAELTQALFALVELVILHRGNEAVELLFLVTLTVLLDNNGACQMLEEVGTEHLHCFTCAAFGKVVVDALSLGISLFVEKEVSKEAVSTTLCEFFDLGNECIILSFSEIFNLESIE